MLELRRRPVCMDTLVSGKPLFLQTKGKPMLDTIAHPTIFHLQKPIETISVTTDSLSGTRSYQIALATNGKGRRNSSLVIWKTLSFGLLVVVLASAIWLWLRNHKLRKQPMTGGENSESALRNELFHQSEAYKLLVRKGYYSVNRKTGLELLSEQEISALCDAVTHVFSTFSERLRESDLPEKDYQFCCLLKSGLSTFELAEIYCVSESAIFKRKQKLKEKLDFGSDGRTLDAIVQEL